MIVPAFYSMPSPDARWTSRLTIVCLLAFCTWVAGCARSAEVFVINHSSIRLLDVVVTAADSSTLVDFVEPMNQRRLLLCPKGEAGSLQISFTAAKTMYKATQELYFECSGSYRVQIDVSPQLAVSSSVSLR
jgi:hypothetical protein